MKTKMIYVPNSDVIFNSKYLVKVYIEKLQVVFVMQDDIANFTVTGQNPSHTNEIFNQICDSLGV